MIDIHAHVLPGLDDGPANMGEALDLARAAHADGIDRIVATPHMLDGVYDAARADVFAGVARLNDALGEHGIPLLVLAGADIHVETEIPQLLRDSQLVTVADRGKHLLLELPSDVVPGKLDQLLFAVQLQGVHPVISHPERNRVIQEDSATLIPLVEAGCLTQVTAASLVGDFGRQVQDCARGLFEYRMAHFVATDMHDTRHRAPRLSAAAAELTELIGDEEAKEVLEENPEALLHGRHIQAPDPVVPKPRRKWFFW